MESLATVLPVVLIVILVGLLLGWWWMRRDREMTQVAADQDRIDTLIGWPPQPTCVLSQTERTAYALLVRALPDYMVFAHVPLARFLNVPKRNSYADWLRRLGYQCVDFVVCDIDAQVITVIELQPPPARVSERSKKRLARMSRSLKAANVPLQVWPEQSLPTAEMVREIVVMCPHPGGATPEPKLQRTVNPAAEITTVAAISYINSFDDTSSDSVQDEPVRLMEPPPSTWFDDMDSEAAPLAPNKR